MTASTELYNAHIEQSFYLMYRTHRIDGLKVCDANRAMLESYLNEHILDCTPANLEIAYKAIKKQLVHEKNPAPVAKPIAPVEVNPPEQIDEQQRLRAMTTEQLREVVRGQRKYQTRDGAAILDPLPANYDASTIRQLPAKELSKLIHRYGGSVVTARLQGRS
jgi:hypothetical protein